MNLEILLACCLEWSWKDDDMFLNFRFNSILFGVMDSIGTAGHPDDRADQRSKEERNATGTRPWESLGKILGKSQSRGKSWFVASSEAGSSSAWLCSWIRQSKSTLKSSVVNFDKLCT